MVSSGRPSPPWRLVTSWPSMVPTVRLTLRIGNSSLIGVLVSMAERAAEISCWSSARSRPWSWPLVL